MGYFTFISQQAKAQEDGHQIEKVIVSRRKDHALDTKVRMCACPSLAGVYHQGNLG
jgi:hypothetical protein